MKANETGELGTRLAIRHFQTGNLLHRKGLANGVKRLRQYHSGNRERFRFLGSSATRGNGNMSTRFHHPVRTGKREQAIGVTGTRMDGVSRTEARGNEYADSGQHNDFVR
jgi:hypothetical protein